MNLFLKDRQAWTEGFLPAHVRTLTLAGYVPANDEQAEAKAAVADYIEAVCCGEPKSLVLYGKPNTTKTLLAACIWNAVAPHIPDRSRYDETLKCGTADNIGFFYGSDLAGLVKLDPDNPRPTGPSFLRHVKTCRFCVLDDFDKAPAGNWGSEWLGIIEARMALPTVITMNSTPAAFARKYGEHGLPTISRLERTGGTFIRLG